MRKCLIALALTMISASLIFSHHAAAKGEVLAAIHISGGDLPHPVTVTLLESNLAFDGSSSQAQEFPAPPADSVTYRIRMVDPEHPNNVTPVGDSSYVLGSPSLGHAPLSGSWRSAPKAYADVVDRYLSLTRAGALEEAPTFAESLKASATAFPTTVGVGSKDLSSDQTEVFLSLLGHVEPVYFGVQGKLIGHRDLSPVTIHIAFGPYDLDLAYVPAGPIAPYGLLFDPRLLGNWDYLKILDPPGYAQFAYRVPDKLQAMMSALGHPGSALQEIVSPRMVPLLEARREFVTDHIVARDRAGNERRLPIEGVDVCALSTVPPEAPGGDAALTVEAWPRGFQPFPEAVVPAIYDYYPAQPPLRDRGVLVATQTGAVYDSVPGGNPPPPCNVDPHVEALLQNAMEPQSRSQTFGIVIAVALAWLTVVGASTLFVTRRRRSL
jgi:hypothetical protein